MQMPEEREFARLYGMAVAGDMLAGKTTPHDGAKEMYRVWINWAAESFTAGGRR